MQRYILKISYDGANYSGFQIQKDKVTIQGELESALKQVLKSDISIVASGRTDAGVSAICQVCTLIAMRILTNIGHYLISMQYCPRIYECLRSISVAVTFMQGIHPSKKHMSTTFTAVCKMLFTRDLRHKLV